MWKTVAPRFLNAPTSSTLLQSCKRIIPPDRPFFLDDRSRTIQVTSTSSFLDLHKSASPTPALNAYLFWMSRRFISPRGAIAQDRNIQPDILRLSHGCLCAYDASLVNPKVFLIRQTQGLTVRRCRHELVEQTFHFGTGCLTR